MGTPDLVQLRGLRVMGTHGALVEERERAQPFEIDLDLELDLEPAGRSDGLADTVDYGVVVARVVAVVAERRYSLLEALAAGIADELLAEPRLTAVTVALRKLRPPVPVDLAWAGVRITRTAPRRPSGQ